MAARWKKLSELIDFAIKLQRKPSPLDVYRDLFTVEVGKDGKGTINYQCQRRLDYRKPISQRQYAWYNGAKDDEREDVGLTIATRCSPRTYNEYLMRHPIYNHREDKRHGKLSNIERQRLPPRSTDRRLYSIDKLNSRGRSQFVRSILDEKARQDFLLSIAMLASYSKGCRGG